MRWLLVMALCAWFGCREGDKKTPSVQAPVPASEAEPARPTPTAPASPRATPLSVNGAQSLTVELAPGFSIASGAIKNGAVVVAVRPHAAITVDDYWKQVAPSTARPAARELLLSSEDKDGGGWTIIFREQDIYHGAVFRKEAGVLCSVDGGLPDENSINDAVTMCASIKVAQ